MSELVMEDYHQPSPSCTSLCLFLSQPFVNNLDRIGLATSTQKNFSPTFLAARNDLYVRRTSEFNQPSPTEVEKTGIAAQIYRKLTPSRVRLLRLLPGTFSKRLDCELFEHDIDSHSVEYNALSYTWGKPKFPARIYCNGVAVPITQNLSDALHFLRDETNSQTLWIDALCINQTDLDEKTRQIPLMYKIYANAKQTFVWLGLANERDQVMIEQLKTVCAALEEQLSGRHTSQCVDVIVQMHDWAYQFLSRAWFTRSWIRQEVAASTSCSIVCGDSRITFNDFEKGMTRFLELDVQLPRHTASMPVQSDTAAVRFYRLLKHRKDLTTLVTRASDAAHAQCASEAGKYLPVYICREWFRLVLQGSIFAATDSKDKIFSMGFALQNALAPISNTSKDVYSDFQMDYKLSMSCVYQNFFKALINTSHTLDPLSFFRPNFSFDPQSTLPTWMPDLRKPVSGCLTISSPSVVGTAEQQQLSDIFVPLRLLGVSLGQIRKPLDFDDSVKDLNRVRLDDLEDLGIHTSDGMTTTWLDQLWQSGEPLNTILIAAGYAIYELIPTAHARKNLGLDADIIAVFVSRDAQAGDLVVCAYGGFHPFVLRTDPTFLLQDGTVIQQFMGPSVVWRQYTGDSNHASSQKLLQMPTITDRTAMKLGWQRWRPSAQTMNDRLLGKEENFSLF